MAINAGKVVAGGLVAGVVMNIIDFALNHFVFAEPMRTAMDALNPTLMAGMEGVNTIVGFIVLDFVLGILTVLTYASIRPRFGPGPGTAVKAGLLVWAISGATWAFLCVMGILSTSFFLMSAAGALVNFLISAWAGAKFYTET